MIPYLRPDFPPLALAMMKGILDQYGVDTKSRDFNTDVHEYFKNNEIVELEKFCSEDNPARYKPIHFGNYLERTFKTSYSSIIE